MTFCRFTLRFFSFSWCTNPFLTQQTSNHYVQNSPFQENRFQYFQWTHTPTHRQVRRGKIEMQDSKTRVRQNGYTQTPKRMISHSDSSKYFPSLFHLLSWKGSSFRHVRIRVSSVYSSLNHVCMSFVLPDVLVVVPHLCVAVSLTSRLSWAWRSPWSWSHVTHVFMCDVLIKLLSSNDEFRSNL